MWNLALSRGSAGDDPGCGIQSQTRWQSPSRDGPAIGRRSPGHRWFSGKESLRKRYVAGCEPRMDGHIKRAYAGLKGRTRN